MNKFGMEIKRYNMGRCEHAKSSIGIKILRTTFEKKISVGLMVALTFLTEFGIDYTKRKVKHIDGNINNNRIEDLIWIKILNFIFHLNGSFS